MGEGERSGWKRLFDARAYREAIGGPPGTGADREVMRALEEAAQVDSRPWVENRAFLVRAVTYLARDAGIDQFLDVGAGLPAPGSVHETARRYRPGAAVAYVDHDREVVAAWREVAAGQGPMSAVLGDVTEPRRILEHPGVRAVLDFDRPVGLLLTAVLYMIEDEGRHRELVRTLTGALPPGSHLVLNQLSAEGLDPEPVERVRRIAESLGGGLTVRSHAEIARLFEGLDLVEPGLVRVPYWRPVRLPARPSGWFFGGVGRKP